MEWNTAAIRDLVGAAFSDEEVTTLCFDHFRSVYEEFSSGMSKRDKIQRLLDYCERHDQLSKLVRLVKELNQAQYNRYASRLEQAPRKEPAEADEARGPAPHPAASGPLGPIRNRWALLVGVNAYIDPAIPRLRFCVNDILALEQMLKTLGYTVVALHDDVAAEYLLPTRDNVEAELARICQNAGQDDLMLVHFACHGTLVDGKPVLVTHETRLPTLATKALPLADVEARMRASKARRLVLMLDACHTGVEMGRDLVDPEFIHNAYESAEGFALIAASTAQQAAQEWKEKEHGVFTYYLLDGLSGKADREGKQLVTVDDLKTHVLDGLRRWNVEHGGLLQEPTARTEGMGDMILADYRDQPSPDPRLDVAPMPRRGH